jgi:DNA-binding transcriptional LysR family regulator
MDDIDWTLYRSFLAVAETGSLSAAARKLNLSQPTLGRHIAELETSLATPLFTRQAKGLAPTEAALALIPAATTMRDAAARMSLTAAGRQEQLSGTVRLTASQVVSHNLLPAMLARLRDAEPGIEIELVPSDSTENLLFREADIALRMYRPTQNDVVIRHLIDLPMSLYGLKILQHCHIVGMDRSELMMRMVERLGLGRRREDFPVRCDDQLVYWALVRAGCGLGAALTLIGDADPLMERVAPFLPLPDLPVWLTAPEALRQNPRIRRVLDHLAAEFRALSPPA